MTDSLLVRVAPLVAARWPLHDVAATRDIEQQPQAALPPHTLMRRAGRATARLALALAPHAPRFWVAAGPGNNGGDGLEAALALQAMGKQVEVSLLGDPARLPADAADALQRARDAGVAIRPDLPSAPIDAALAIDALLGLGGTRPADGAIAEAIARLNAHAGLVLAVDLPSGLDIERGQPRGGLAVRATHTLSLLTLKPGLFTAAGRDHAGAVWLCDLGVSDAREPAAWLAGAPSTPTRRHAQHKGSFGDVLVVGGAAGMTGAAWLAAAAALHAGAGRVYVDPLAGESAPAPERWPELMRRPGMGAQAEALAQATVVCGCGGGAVVAERLPAILHRSARLVLDADALNAIAADASLAARLQARGSHGLPTLLTPHPLEAARLLGSDAAAVQADRLQAAQALAQRFDCAVLLKGSGTVCAAPGRTPSINPTGNALLASPGTGDVLAGWCGGRWSAMAEAAAQDVAIAAAWEHGAAADRAALAGRRGPLTAGALLDALAS